MRWGLITEARELRHRTSRRCAERHGGIGVAISLFYWFIIIAALVVSVAVVGAELARRRLVGPEETS